MSSNRNITWKYLRFFSKSKAVMAMTIISILGIAIGVATLTITLSIASGFGDQYRKSILDFSAHVVLLSTEEIEDASSVQKQLDQFRASEEDVKDWEGSSLSISILRVVERLWWRVDDLYVAAQYSSVIPQWFFSFIDYLHPKRAAEWAYAKDFYPRALVKRIEKILKMSRRGIIGVNPFIYREGLLIHKGQIRGIMIKGVDSVGMKKVSNMDVTFEQSDDEGSRIVLGSYLAKEIGAKTGDQVRLMLPKHWSESGAKGFQKFIVSGTFESGMYDFDSQFALLDLREAQKIFGVSDRVSGFEIKLDDWEKSGAVAMSLEQEFPYPMYASDWRELNKSLFEAVKLEKLMFLIIMGALVIVAAFNIIGTVMLRILYKTSDIAILRALGMKTGKIKQLFIAQGIFTGLLGTVLGLGISLIFAWSITEFGWIKIPAEIYLVNTLPICISFTACVMIAAFSLLVCWLTSAIASRRILELPIIRGLHRP
jgi:lipoprotein-releasing system permease protein